MIQCPKCSAENLPENRFCSSCGQELSSVSQMPTMEAPEPESPPAPAQSPHVGRIISSDSVPAGGFSPGTILADRYRIIGLLGRGGMGEVYRADDLKLGQPVALKFLPPALAKDSVRRERFFAEVRITRQLSHPNICRVYDIGEVDGRHFLSMEYIDGEDLASLIKRIGHLSNEKALDIARQLVAGLTVAHERGVLHRDLKPANIMLDGHGRVRITDFGLAIAAEDEAQAEEIAGTPAYMAPEQLAGKGATVRSDIYSLGLILYEVYTGKKAFKAKTLAELREQKETQTPRAPSELRDGIDPVVERVIQRCIEKEPSSRPASVAQLAQALPGGDPLAAAIAAGETPSPEMVAASGSKEGLRLAVAWGILVSIILGTLAILAMNDHFMLHRLTPLKKSPEILAERSRELIKKLGYSEEASDKAYGFMVNEAMLYHIGNSDKTANRWKNLDPKVILFWYRQSPHSLDFPFASRIGYDNPPLQYSGEVRLMLDTEARLTSFDATPVGGQSSTQVISAPNWETLFDEAGLDISQWTEIEAQWNPFFYADTRASWQGSLPNEPTSPIRIEAEAFQGKPISFRIIGPWTQTAIATVSQGRIPLLFLLAVIMAGIFVARRNLRLGRGDRRNATRLAFFVLGGYIVLRALNVHRVAALLQWGAQSVCLGLFWASLTWILYMAIEPFVRRHLPQTIISWTRILSGEYRDPVVARDALVGCGFGILMTCLGSFAVEVAPRWLGHAALLPPFAVDFGNLSGTRFFISGILGAFGSSVLTLFLVTFTLVLLQVLLRNKKVAIAAYIIIYGLFAGEGNPWLIGIWMVQSVLFIFMLVRFGLVAAVFFGLTWEIFHNFPMTFDATTWLAGYGFAALVIFASIVLYAFYTSLGGRPMFGTPQLDE